MERDKEFIIVDPKNKWTFSPHPVGEVSNLAGAECPINSKLYYKSKIRYFTNQEMMEY